MPRVLKTVLERIKQKRRLSSSPIPGKSTGIRQRYREIAPHFTLHQTRGGRIWKLKKLSRSNKFLVSIYVQARFIFAFIRLEIVASINLLAACFCWFVLQILKVEWRQIAALHISFWCMVSPDHLGGPWRRSWYLASNWRSGRGIKRPGTFSSSTLVATRRRLKSQGNFFDDQPAERDFW